MAKIKKDKQLIKEEKARLKAKKKKMKIVKEKDDVPVLKSPTESRIGRIVIWFLLIAMGIGGLATVIYLIITLSIH